MFVRVLDKIVGFSMYSCANIVRYTPTVQTMFEYINPACNGRTFCGIYELHFLNALTFR